jgi:hypothetical protein
MILGQWWRSLPEVVETHQKMRGLLFWKTVKAHQWLILSILLSLGSLSSGYLFSHCGMWSEIYNKYDKGQERSVSVYSLFFNPKEKGKLLTHTQHTTHTTHHSHSLWSWGVGFQWSFHSKPRYPGREVEGNTEQASWANKLEVNPWAVASLCHCDISANYHKGFEEVWTN